MNKFFKLAWLGVFLLTGCGFQPLYGSSMHPVNATTDQLRSIAIANIPDRSGVQLKNELIDRLYSSGGPVTPDYTLTVAPLSESMSDLDLTIDEDATRRQLRLETTLTLSTHKKEGMPPVPDFTRSVYSIVSFNVLESRFTTRVAEDNARQNAIADLARQIEQAIILHLNHPLHPTTDSQTSPPTP